MTTETPQTENEAAGGQSRAGEAGANLTNVLATPPITKLGKRLMELRRRYIRDGGSLYSLDEINAELHRERG